MRTELTLQPKYCPLPTQLTVYWINKSIDQSNLIGIKTCFYYLTPKIINFFSFYFCRFISFSFLFLLIIYLIF